MKILCACLGNSDRSPFMKAFLEQALKNRYGPAHDCTIDSAGVFESARKGGDPMLSVKKAKTYGFDLSEHKRTHVDDIDLKSYEYIIVANKTVQTEFVKRGVKTEIICLELEGADNAWMSKDPRKVDAMIANIQWAITTYVIQYKFAV